MKNIIYLLGFSVLSLLSPANADTRDSGSIPTLGGAACNLIYTPDSESPWKINRFALDVNLDNTETLFASEPSATIQSVACDLGGTSVYFSQKLFDDDDFEIYRLNLTSPDAQPIAITDNSVDDTNITASGDSSVIAWQSEFWLDSSDDYRQVITIQENESDGSTNIRTLNSANHYLQPSLSKNGEWLTTVQRRSGADLVWKYNLADKEFTRVSSVPRRKGAYNPSITDDGSKVAWVEGKGKNVLIMKDDTTGTGRQLILSNANGIGHPFLADSGNMVMYSIIRDRKSYTYIYDISKDQQYRLGNTLRGEFYSGNTWLTANQNNLCKLESSFPQDDLDQLLQLSPNCASLRKVDDGDHYARFFTFELETEQLMNIRIGTNRFTNSILGYDKTAPLLFLSKGHSFDGEVIDTSVDQVELANSVAVITRVLAPGKYTLEVTSSYRFLAGALYRGFLGFYDTADTVSLNDCINNIPLESTIDSHFYYGESETCLSPLGNNPYYPSSAMYYTFTLPSERYVTLTAYGSSFSVLQLFSGQGEESELLSEATPKYGAANITQKLLAGTHTVVLHADNAGYRKEDFSIRVHTEETLCTVASLNIDESAPDESFSFYGSGKEACPSHHSDSSEPNLADYRTFTLTSEQLITFEYNSSDENKRGIRILQGEGKEGEVIAEDFYQGWVSARLGPGSYTVEGLNSETNSGVKFKGQSVPITTDYFSDCYIESIALNSVTSGKILGGDNCLSNNPAPSNDTPTYSRYYHLTAALESQRIGVILTNPELTLVLRRGNQKDGEIIRQSTNALAHTLTKGEYMLEVVDTSNSHGAFFPSDDYTLTVKESNCEAIPMDINDSFTEFSFDIDCAKHNENGTLIYLKNYDFTLDQPQELRIYKKSPDIGWTAMKLFKYEGDSKTLLINMANDTFPHQLEAGNYSLRIENQAVKYNDVYSFEFEKSNCGITDINLNTITEGSTTENSCDYSSFYRFTINNDKNISLALDGEDFLSFALYSPSGDLIVIRRSYGSGARAVTNRYMLPAGTYTVKVDPWVDSNDTEYQLELREGFQ